VRIGTKWLSNNTADSESSECRIYHSLALCTELCISFMIREENFSDTTTTERIFSVRYIFLVLKFGHVGKIGQKHAEGLDVWCCRRKCSISPVV